jgi:hypothetical protein
MVKALKSVPSTAIRKQLLLQQKAKDTHHELQLIKTFQNNLDLDKVTTLNEITAKGRENTFLFQLSFLDTQNEKMAQKLNEAYANHEKNLSNQNTFQKDLHMKGYEHDKEMAKERHALMQDQLAAGQKLETEQHKRQQTYEVR